MPSFVLASTTAVLIAMDVPFPVELTALAMVGLILRVYIGRENKDKELQDRRLTALEHDASEQRHLKHAQINANVALRGALELVHIEAQRCTCDALAPVLPLIRNLLHKEGP